MVLTKLDGDARGGAALSVRQVTGKPIKFAGVGEKLAGLEAFHPERMAARILGMGDVLSLVEEAQQRRRSGRGAEIRRQDEDAARASTWRISSSRSARCARWAACPRMMDKLPAQLAGGAGSRRAA